MIFILIEFERSNSNANEVVVDTTELKLIKIIVQWLIPLN